MVAAGQKCKRCGAEIVWLKTEKGAWMPTDASSVRPTHMGLPVFNLSAQHVPHWATCPHAKEFRKKNPDPPAAPEPKAETEEQALIRRCREKGIIK